MGAEVKALVAVSSARSHQVPLFPNPSHHITYPQHAIAVNEGQALAVDKEDHWLCLKTTEVEVGFRVPTLAVLLGQVQDFVWYRNLVSTSV